MSLRPTPPPSDIPLRIPEGTGLASGPGGVGCVFVYRYAGVSCRTDCPSIKELEDAGWTVVHRNQWGSALMRKAAP